jgi:hypothetical protein
MFLVLRFDTTKAFELTALASGFKNMAVAWPGLRHRCGLWEVWRQRVIGLSAGMLQT